MGKLIHSHLQFHKTWHISCTLFQRWKIEAGGVRGNHGIVKGMNVELPLEPMLYFMRETDKVMMKI
ncbi:hypothetical protein DQG13_24060 [Paenibacillus sp. YN15]|nr:hypothetical protein DQG13_24060 [Paenibacillus sp. YN15]